MSDNSFSLYIRIFRDACSVAKILTKYVERGKLPSHTPLIALLDMYAMVNNHNDHRIYAPDSYPYKVWLWRSLLIRDQPQVDEFIELLSQFLEGKDTVFNASTFYNFLSTTAHKISSEYGNKVEGISDTSGKLSRLNKIRDQISDKAEWAKYTAGWTCEYVTAFVQAISPLLTFKALRAVVRMTTAMKTRKMNAYPAFTYLIREVCLDLARTLNLVAFDKLNDEAITYINNAVNRLSSIKHDAIGVAEDFWGYVGDLMNEPEEASAKYYTYEDDDYVLPLQAIAEDFVATIQRTYDYSCISTWGYDQYIDYADDINLGFLNPPGKPNDKPLTNNTVPLADANN